MSTTRTIHSVGIPFIKFQDRDKIEYLQKGKIYFKSLAYYRQREIETHDDTVGDSFEAMIHINNGLISVPELSTFERLDDALIQSSFANHFVFCMLSFPEDTDSFAFTEEQKQNILTFGNFALLITDRCEFLRRVAIALDREKIIGTHGYVKYYDETKDNLNYWMSIFSNGIEDVAFWKRKHYKYQQEYRFLITPPTTVNDYYELEIGSIEDISIILTAEQALNAMASKYSET